MTLLIHLRIAGILLLLLAGLNFLLPRRLRWKEELARLSLLNRQIFLVHCLFIVLTVSMFGVLSLCYGDALLRPAPLAKFMAAGLTLFWGLRLVIQLFVYDARLWRGQRFNTVVHFVFTAMWAYFTAVYGGVLWWQMSGGM